MDELRTTYARAVSGYDAEFERTLLAAITTTIAETSRAADCNVIMLRTGETTSALVTALAGVLALSPAAVRSPTSVRKTADEIRKRLQRRVAAAEHDPDVQAFVARCFRTDDGGHA